jgi:3-methyladenine DNA glycosylase AlkD
MSEYQKIQSELRSLADPIKAKVLSRFFKTGQGEYGQGDRFLGVVVPKIRKIVKSHRQASMDAVLKLLRSPYHEERLTALLMLVEKYRRGEPTERRAIYDLYLGNTPHINNWDLVDLTAQHIVGNQIYENHSSALAQLAASESLWERRIAMLSTYYHIRRGESREALHIARLLLHDRQDLIHKAVGWMLREVGKRCSIEAECGFLDEHAAAMPRTMLRYAIEGFPESLKRRYMGQRRRQANRKKSDNRDSSGRRKHP